MNQDYYRPMSFRVLPPVVKNLLIINGLFFIATIVFQESFQIDLIDKLGLRYPGAEKFRPYQFITYMFLHAGWAHLFFNLFALWMFGYTLENIWGPRRFLVYYFVTGIGAAMIHYLTIYLTIQPELTLINQFLYDPTIPNLNALIQGHSFQITRNSGEIVLAFAAFKRNYELLLFNPGNTMAMQQAIDFVSEYKTYFLNLPNVVGASGAVFGILLAFGLTFPNAIIYIYFFFPLKAKWFVIIYGAMELYFGISGSSGNVAHFAHLGGMIFGYLLLLFWRHQDKPRYFI